MKPAKVKEILKNTAAISFSVFISLTAAVIFILCIGKNPTDIINRFSTQILGSSYGMGMILFQSTPLMFTGLAAAFAFRGGFFNIGTEGQMVTGSLITAYIGFSLTGVPSIILLPLSVITGFIGGAFWGGIAGYLKARFGSHEVIVTIMLNFIAIALAGYMVNNVFGLVSTVHTPEISPNAVIPRFDSFSGLFTGSPFNLSILIALFCCYVMAYIINKTPSGYEIRTLGLNTEAARYARMNTSKLTILTMLISGGFAGLAGTNFVLGYKHYYEIGFSEGAGYMGIAVALVAKNNPFAVILVSVFFGFLEYGGLIINSEVPKELVTMLQAMIIFFLIIFSNVLNKKFKS